MVKQGHSQTVEEHMNEKTKALPEYGIVQIDGKAVTSIRYDQNKDGKTYDLTLRLGSQVVGKIKAMSLADLDEVIGEKNANEMFKRSGTPEGEFKPGSLKGHDLSYHYGMTPASQEAGALAERTTGDELNRVVDRDGSVRELPEGIALAKSLGITPEELDRRLQNEHQRQEAEGATASNAVTRNRLHVDDSGKSPAEMQAAEQDADKLRRDTERAQLRTEVEKQFLVRDDRYYFKDNHHRLAIADRGNKILSPENDARVAIAMAKLAESKGWDSIKVKGTPEFQREVWLEASSRGLKVQGYTPTEADKAALDVRNESRLKNHVEQGAPEKVPGGASPEAHKATRHGEAGIKTATQDSAKKKQQEDPSKEKVETLRKKKQREEDYNQLRPDNRKRIEKQRIVEAVATAIAAEKISNPATRAAMSAEVRRQLDKMSAKGRDVPTLHTYDRTAPAKARESDRARTQVERHTERTR